MSIKKYKRTEKNIKVIGPDSYVECYNKRYKKVATVNRDDLCNNFDIYIADPDSYLSKKIITTAERQGVEPQALRNALIDEHRQGKDFLLGFFIKNPDRQNISESLQKDIMNESGKGVFSKTEKLNTDSNNAIYVNRDGEIVQGKHNVAPNVKSFDFRSSYSFNGNELSILTIAKHTKEAGGNQDNQKNDVLTTLEYVKKIKDENVAVIALLDGLYYKKDHKEGSWLEYIKNYCDYPRFAATDSDGIRSCVLQIIEDWMDTLDCDGVKEEKERVRKLLSVPVDFSVFA